ncbi:MAG: hypothetical protein ACREMY_11775, partial [bacterium]
TMVCTALKAGGRSLAVAALHWPAFVVETSCVESHARPEQLLRKGVIMNVLKQSARRFIRVEDGLVTVEWVALTAGMVVAAVAIGFIVMQNTYGQGDLVGKGIIEKTESVYGTDGANLKGAPPAP